MERAPHTVSVIVEIRELVTPLSYYTQRIFKKSNHNQEPANCGEVSVAMSQLHIPLRSVRECPLMAALFPGHITHGLIGSEIVSSQSSILLVCSLN